MNYLEKIVEHKGLKNDVLCYWQMKGSIPASEIISSRHIPKGQNLLIFNYGDVVEVTNSKKENFIETPFFVIPAISSSSIVSQTGNIDLFGISFIGDGLYKLIPHPIATLGYNFPEGLKDDYHAFYNKSKGLNFDKKAELIERFILENVDSKRNNKTFNKAFDKIKKTKGAIRIEALANELGVSTRQLQRLFKNRMGISPKDYCKIIRVNNYLNFILKAENSIDWMQLVAAFDYHDQPHLINEVKSIVQLSPQKLLKYRDTLYHRYTTN